MSNFLQSKLELSDSVPFLDTLHDSQTVEVQVEDQHAVFRVEDGSYSVLRHVYDSKGTLISVLPCPVLGFVVGPIGVEFVISLIGIAPVHSVPIWGPEGAVHMDGNTWPDFDTYEKWAKRHMQ